MVESEEQRGDVSLWGKEERPGGDVEGGEKAIGDGEEALADERD